MTDPPSRPVRTSAWGAAWIEAVVLARTFDGAGLARGRGLAARGGVDDFSIEPASVAGVVRGRSALERRVRLGVRRFTAAQWSVVAAELASSKRLVAAVLDGELPEALHDRLVAAGVGLMPGVLDVSIDCTCGNQAESCVHAAAVCCRLGDELDADPLLLITLRGGDRAALLAGLVPPRVAPTAHPDGRLTASIPGRPNDPGVAAPAAWRRHPEPLPEVDVRRRSPGRPRVGSVAPSVDHGFDQAGLDRLVRDAAVRATALLARSDGATTALELDTVTDVVRRAATSTLGGPGADVDLVAEAAGVPAELVAGLIAAWRRCGPAGVDVMLRPRRLHDDEIAAIEAAWETAVKSRSTGAVLPAGRQVRRAVDGTWVVLDLDEVIGWNVVDAGVDLEELAG